ncbi:MAG: hypothetical protein D6731_06255 [Planctomycetota bacterium]|nr:MAG: hypothetical protein D6731_06255 [Planctomycetota bacterium]
MLLLLCGCLQTHDERVRVRRPPELVEREERWVRPDAYEEFLAERQREEERRRLTPALRRELGAARAAEARIDAVLASIPVDPFAAEERDRRAVLRRAWRDRLLPPPEPDESAFPSLGAPTEAEEAEDEGAGEQNEDEAAADEGEEAEEEDWEEDEEDWDE